MLDYSKLVKLIETAEDEFHDFKQEWHGKKTELVRDILNFVTPLTHEDCYIIFGVSDDGNILGVPSENRKTEENLIDLLHNLYLSTNNQIKISVDTMTYKGKELDILTIYDTDLVPVYLTRKYTAKQEQDLPAGFIYARNGAINTPRNESADFEKINALFKKYNHLDTSIQDQYFHILLDYGNWSYVENEDGCNFIYNLNSDFYMHIREDKENRSDIEAFSVNLVNPHIGWSLLELKFRHLTIFEKLIVALDSANILVPSPEYGFYEIGGLDNLSYYSYQAGSLSHLLYDFLKNVYPSFDSYSESCFRRGIVFYDLVDESEKVHQVIQNEYTDEKIKDLISVASEDVTKRLKWVKMKSKDVDEYFLKNMMEQNIFTTLIKDKQKQIGYYHD